MIGIRKDAVGGRGQHLRGKHSSGGRCFHHRVLFHRASMPATNSQELREGKGSGTAHTMSIFEGNAPQSSWRWALEPRFWQTAYQPAPMGPLGLPTTPEGCESESAFKQAVAPTAGGTHLLGPKPLHHVAGVPRVHRPGRSWTTSHSHVADGTLGRQAFADGTLRARTCSGSGCSTRQTLEKGGGGQRTR